MRDLNDINLINVKINELSDKESSPTNLNMLGDLYLKKGDKKKAVEYFYKAAKSFAHDKKALSVYKKILDVLPTEVTAYERIIDMFSESGLVADEINYLLKLAQVYQNSGDFEKATLTFRRIHELDPANKAATLFFSRGKVNIRDIDQSGEVNKLNKEIDKTEETIREEKLTSMQKRRKFISIVAVIILLSFIVGLSIYLTGESNKSRRTATPKEQVFPSTDESPRALDTKTVKGDNFEIELTRLTDELIYKLPIVSRLPRKELSENGFYLIKVKAVKGCIPEDFIKYTSRYVSLINRQDKLIKPKELAGLDSIKKVFYKTNICQKESGIIFTQFYISYSKEFVPKGVFIDGLESRYPVIVKWD